MIDIQAVFQNSLFHWKSIVYVMYTIDFQRWQWILEHSPRSDKLTHLGALHKRRNREQRTENRERNHVLWNTQFLIGWNSYFLFLLRSPLHLTCVQLHIYIQTLAVFALMLYSTCEHQLYCLIFNNQKNKTRLKALWASKRTQSILCIVS